MQYNDTSTTTLYGLKQDIYFLAKCNSTSISDGDLNRIINKYYLQLQEAVRAVNENFYLTVATSNLVIGNGSYTFPDGVGGGASPAYEKIHSLWTAFLPASIATPLYTEFTRVDFIDPSAISDPEYTFSTDAPKAIVFGSYFTLLPLVTDATKYPVVGGLKIYYIKQPTKLSADIDVPDIFPDYHDAITQGSLIDVAERLGNAKLKADSVKLFAKRIVDIKSYASNRIPPELGIVEGQDRGGGWAYNFGNTNMS